MHKEGQREQIVIKSNMFADDTQMFNRTHGSVYECIRIMKIYEKASGARVNYTKTKGLLLGTWRTKPPPRTKFKWITGCIKALGIYHGYKIDKDKLWNEKLDKIQRNLKPWSNRDLTYAGKVLLIKTLGFSITNYKIEYVGIPNNNKTELTRIFRNFL